MKVFAALVAVIAACVLAGCTRTTTGMVAQTTEPLSAAGMTCSEFTALGEADRLKVVNEILAKENANEPAFITVLVATMCEYMPQVEVKQVLLGFTGP